MVVKALTDLQVKALKPPLTRQEVSFGGGLFLVVSPTGHKSWAYRHRWEGRPVKLTLGRYMSPGDQLPAAREAAPAVGGTLSIVQARHLSNQAALHLQQGLNPSISLRPSEASTSTPATVEEAFAEFDKRHMTPNNKASTAKESRRLFDKRIRPEWSARPIDSIRRSDVIDLLDSIIDDDAPITANRVFALVRKFFNWCGERGLVDVSPCTHLRLPTQEAARDRYLSDHEIKLVWQAVGRLETPYSSLFKSLLLTGQRRAEVAGMTWHEADLDNAKWSLPGNRTKNGKPNMIWLSKPMILELAAIPRFEGEPRYVFTRGPGLAGDLIPVSGFSKLKDRIDDIILEIKKAELENQGRDPDDARPLEPWRIHDLRRTVATGMQRLGVPLVVIEKVLNHISGSTAGIVGTYQVHAFAEEKKAALDAWAQHILSLDDPLGGQ
jgi:integrase